MRRAVLALLLAVAGPARAGVEALDGGQYYHRPGHLQIDEARALTHEAALARGLAPCPECTPERAPSAYYDRLLELRRAGELWLGVRPGGAVATWATEDVVRATPPAPREAPRPEFPDEIAVPGTAGLLKVPTFKGSGAIVPVPLPMGGFVIVEPPRPAR